MTLPPHRERRLPMSSAQRRLYLQCQLPGGDRAYHLLYPARLRGPFSLDAARAFAERMVQRHEALRSAFRMEQGEFFCEVRRHVDVAFTVLDPVAVTAETGLDALLAALVEAHDTPFDLATPPLFRVIIQPLGPDDCLLLFNCHHLIFDGYSGGIIAQDIMDALAGREPAPMERGYSDFAAWERAFFDSPDYARQRDFWLGRHAKPPERLALPTDFPPPARKSFEGASFIRYLDSRGAKAFSIRQGATLFMTLLAAFYCTLARLTGQSEVTLGTLVSPRERGGFHNVVGLFANTLPLTQTLEAGTRFSDLLQRVRVMVFEALQNAEFPFEHLVAQLPFLEKGAKNPLVDVVFNFERVARQRVETFREVTVEPLDCDAQVSMFDFAVDIVEYESEVRFRVEYATSLFREQTMQGLMDAYFSVVAQVCARPELTLGELCLVPDEALARLAGWNDTARPIRGGGFLDTWRRQAEESADNPAVRLGERELSYAQLEARANRMAQLLLRRGVGPGAVVAVALDPTPDWPAALLGIWKAGATYLPLSTVQPWQRLRRQLDDSGAALVLTQAAQLGAFAGFPAVEALDALEPELAACPAQAPDLRLDPDRPAYILYTSGSTGAPKGVLVDHRAVHAHLEAVKGVYRLQPDDNVLQFAAPTFDASLEQILATLSAGACLVLLDSRLKAPRALLEFLEAEEISVAEFPPAYLRELLPALRELGPRPLRRLRRLGSGGDVLGPDLAGELLRFLPAGARLLNFYGPTEAAMAASVFAVPADLAPYAAWRSLPVGRPLPNTRLYIVGPDGALLPVGMAGELCIAGERLARGYLNRPELTAERFVTLRTPGGPERVYRTGDRARWLPDGNVEFLGRLDRQVQVRGYRVEPGEVEQALLAHPEVREAAVFADGDGRDGLLAVVVPRGPDAVGPRALYEWLRERLPDYMIPAAFTLTPELVRNAAGKPDRLALSAAAGADAGAGVSGAGEMPLDPLEWDVWRIWRTILKTPRIGRGDVFFQLGGNSLGVIQVMVAVKNAYGVDLPLALLLNAPTIAGMADFLRGEGGRVASSCVAPLGQGGAAADAPPLLLLPGLGGQLLDLFELSGHLGRLRPCLGLQYPLRGAGPGGIETLAERLLRELEAAAGPGGLPGGCVLLGHSFGGYVAFELARLLERLGRGPRALLLLDVAAPLGGGDFAPSGHELLDMAVWTLLGGRDDALWPPTPAREHEASASGRALAVLQAAHRVPESVGVEEFRQDLGVLAARAVAFGAYAPAGRLRADIRQFRAREADAGQELSGRSWDWSAWTAGAFSRHWTPGSHFTMVKGAHAAALAELIQQTLGPAPGRG